MVTVDVIVPVFGDVDYFAELAGSCIGRINEYAPENVTAGMSVGNNLAECMNTAVAESSADYIMNMGCDDDLDYRFFDNMDEWSADVIIPTTILNGRVIKFLRTDLWTNNFLIAACPVKRERFLECGGYRDYPVLMDWEFWSRCVALPNMVLQDHPESVYYYWKSDKGLNSSLKDKHHIAKSAIADNRPDNVTLDLRAPSAQPGP